MPDFRVTFVFEQTNRGWSEVWYRSAADLAAAADFSAVPKDFAVRFRSQLTIHRSIRVADVLTLRKAQPVIVNQQGSRIGSDDEPGADVVSVAARYVCNGAATGSSRRVWIRGLADIDTQRDPNTGFAFLSPGLRQMTDNYMKALISLSFTIRALPKIDNNINQFYPVTGVVVDPQSTSRTLLQFDAAPPASAPDKIILSGFSPKLLPGLNGIWAVLRRPTPVSLTIGYQLPYAGPWAAGKGKARQANYLYDPMTSGNYDTTVTRDTGRPLAVSRGRRRAVHLRQ